MSNTQHFIETLSEDPVERAIARKATRIMNDSTLTRQQRKELIKKAQRELLKHRQQQQQREKLQDKLVSQPLPTGAQAHCVTVDGGRIYVGALKRRSSFLWMDIGPVPADIAVNAARFTVRLNGIRNRQVPLDPLLARRRELGLASSKP